MYSPLIQIAPLAVKAEVLATVMVVTTASIAPFSVDEEVPGIKPPHGGTPQPVPTVLIAGPTLI